SSSSRRLHAPLSFFFSLRLPPPPTFTLFPSTTLFRSLLQVVAGPPLRVAADVLDDHAAHHAVPAGDLRGRAGERHHAVHEVGMRSEEHTSELQSRSDLVCRLLLEKKKKKKTLSKKSDT